MQEYKILIPVCRDSGRPHRIELWQEFERALLARFGGYTHAGSVSGAWKDESGKTICDRSAVYYVAGSNAADASYLRQLLSLGCQRFDQQCIFLRLPNNSVEFVTKT